MIGEARNKIGQLIGIVIFEEKTSHLCLGSGMQLESVNFTRW